MAQSKDASPGFLEIKPQAKKADKKILALIVLTITGLAVVLMVMMTSSNDEKKEEMVSAPKVELENKPLAPPVEGFGLVMPEALKSQEEAKPESEIKVVGPPQADPGAEARRREADEIRRRKFERDQQAYSANILVRRENAGRAADAQSGTKPESGSSQTQHIPSSQDGYDPAADQDKEAFFTRADAREWISPHTREASRKYELKTGTVIPGVMVSGVNSDLPGNLIAQVTQNVYDTATGRHLLVPQGSKLYGVYDSRVVYGQERVLIAWNRVIFPDGSSVTLGAMPGADMSGYAGFHDQVDNHYLRVFGSAVLMSLVTGGMSYATEGLANNDSNQDAASVQDEMTAALAAQLGQTTLQLLQKNLNIKPTLEIRPGYQFNVVVTKDMAFAGAYE